MSLLRKIAVNALSLSAAKVINPLTAIFLLAAIARTQGAAGVGQYSLVLAIFYIAANFGALGLRTPITRAVSREHALAPEYLGVSLILGLISGGVAIVAVLTLVHALSYGPEIVRSLGVLCIAIIPSVWILHVEALFIAFHRAHQIAAVTVVENLAKVTIGILLLGLGYDMIVVIALIAALRIVTFLVYLRMIFGQIESSVPKPTWRTTRELCRVAPIFTANLLLSAPFARLDLILLSKFGTMADVGYYSAALRLINVASFVPQAVKASILPAFCESLPVSKDQFLVLYRRALAYLSAYGIGSAVAFISLAPIFVIIIYGPDFGASEPVLQILAMTLLFRSTSAAFTSTLFAANLERLDFVSNVTRMIALVATLSLAIPVYGLHGAAYGMVGASIVHFSLTYFFVRRNVTTENALTSYRIPMVAGLAALLVSVWLTGFSVWLGGGAALVVYATIVIVLDKTMYEELVKTASAVRRRLGKTST